MTVKAPRKPSSKRQSAFEIAEQSKLQIGLERPYWLAIRRACEEAIRKPEDRWGFVSAFIAKLDETLRSYSPPKINQPGNLGNFLDHNVIPIEGRVCNWVTLAELILTFGCPVARHGAATIIPVCSLILNGQREASDEA